MTASVLLVCPLATSAAEIRVAAGESIQAAIDKAAAGDVITLAEGVFAERITLAKPITVQGAGWEKTLLKPAAKAGDKTQAEKLAFVDRLEGTGDPREQMRLMQEFLGGSAPPTVAVTSAKDVTLRGLRIGGIAPTNVEMLTADALVHFKAAPQAKMIDCAVVGPYMNGVAVTDGSEVEIKSTLVAALWGTGIAVYPGEQRGVGKPATLKLIESDVRNCYHRCVTIACEGTTIDHCRISGSAWHGVRYDHCSPTITSSHLFGSARCGIYASGKTAATVRNNVFWRNEMSAISCWFANADAIENNTMIENVREGIAVLGGAKPTLTRNVIVGNPIGVVCNQVNGQENAGPGEPKLEKNLLWKNEKDLAKGDEVQPLPEGNVVADA
ncbi:MAG: right-handed parallel beta-helix repeat-containing protein, partial [Tepidisphaeraceae bacterium]